MRAIFFGNMYLSSIQQGIQGMHCISEMFAEYTPELPAMAEEVTFTISPQYLMLDEWMRNHKTVDLRSAGFSEELHKINQFLIEYWDFGNGPNCYPFAAFHESKEALDSALTCVGIIVPEKIYEGARIIKNKMDSVSYQDWVTYNVLSINGISQQYSEFDAELMKLINRYRRAQ